jgi:predicted dehydrogenase
LNSLPATNRTDGPIRVGIVGAGENTRLMHIPGLQSIDGVEVVGVANRTLDSSRQVAQEFGLARTYEDWTSVVADPDLDAIVIGTWPNMHSVVTIAALEAGKHVLCEARMARNAAEAREMLDLARARPTQVAQLVPAPLTLRTDATLSRLLAAGYLGDLLVIDVCERGGFIDREAPLHWRQDAAISGFNVMALGIWYETVLRWVGEAVLVTALSEVFVKIRQDAQGTLGAVSVPDHLDVLATMACGAQAHFQMSTVTGLGDASEAVLFGSEATLRVTEDGLYGGRSGDSELVEIPISPEEEGGWRVEQEFVNAIRGSEPVRLTTFEDGVRYMEFTEAVARSALTGRAVPLPLST